MRTQNETQGDPKKLRTVLTCCDNRHLYTKWAKKLETPKGIANDV